LTPAPGRQQDDHEGAALSAPTNHAAAGPTTGKDSTGRWELVGHGDVELLIEGVRVARGDWIVADRDGIVVVPSAIVDDVVAEAEEKAATESEIRTAVRAGTTPLDAYERYGTF
jgi:4-hydroxy-4-methyl-2-oxoglutarate aldolase